MPSFLNPQFLVETLGLIGVYAIVFAESGLFFGFFLPGDSLLFTAGLFASQGYINIYWLLIGTAVCAIAGDSVGYAFGKKVGPAIFSREDSFFFKKKHVESARVFYEKYGVKTIVFARFVPIVRTFAPIVAGVANMNYRTFLLFNIIGGVCWVFSMTLAGFFLGTFFPNIERYLHYIIFGIIVVSFIPVVVEVVKARSSRE